jgi:enoyl-CoA hydratase/carnithine racemase
VSYRCEQGVAVLTLNRPQALNAMNRAMLREICEVLRRIESDDNVRVLVIHGAGRGFSSGFDLKEQMTHRWQGTEAWRRVLDEDHAATVCVWNSRVPTIAAVHGPCIAGAFEFAMCCDLTVSGEDGIFGEPELKFGAGIVTMILPWLVGPKKAKEIIFLGMDRLTARDAEALGLVNRVVPAGQHLDTALALARHIATVDPMLVRETKKAVNRTFDIMGMREALRACLDIDLHIESQGSPDKRAFFDIARERGLQAAFEWRAARFP